MSNLPIALESAYFVSQSWLSPLCSTLLATASVTASLSGRAPLGYSSELILKIFEWPSPAITMFIFAAFFKSGSKSKPKIMFSAYSRTLSFTSSELALTSIRASLNSGYIFLVICLRTWSRTITRKPPEPQAGSRTREWIVGLSISTIHLMTFRGVKNWPASCLSVLLTMVSYAVPFTSTVASRKEYLAISDAI